MIRPQKGRILFAENYQKTIDRIKSLPQRLETTDAVIKKSNIISDDTGSTISLVNDSSIQEIRKNKLQEIEINNLTAYDESILELNSLQGKVRCIAHCVLIQTKEEYVPAGFVSLKFYTRSELIGGVSTDVAEIIVTPDINHSMLTEYHNERTYFFENVIAGDSLVFIDGPMFSGATTTKNFSMIDQLIELNSAPVFFVKNSDSTRITEEYSDAKNYNSDLHWANTILKAGQATPTFLYKKEGRSKIVFFLKVFENRSPIRIELSEKAFNMGLYPNNLLELIQYQFLANGSQSNVQPRIIQVAELYAREILKSTNIYNEVERMGLTKTMNEERNFY